MQGLFQTSNRFMQRLRQCCKLGATGGAVCAGQGDCSGATAGHHDEEGTVVECSSTWRPLIAAHRGGFGECGVENTASAFDYARSLNVDVQELDVVLTRDEVVVVSHDTNLFRLTGINKDVSTINFSELPEILPSLRKENEENIYGAEDSKFLKFEDFLKKNTSVLLSIEPKQPDEKLIDETIRLLKDYNMIDNCIMGSFKYKTVSLLKKKLGDQPLFMHHRDIFLCVLAFYTGTTKYLTQMFNRVLIVPNPRTVDSFFIRFFLECIIFNEKFFRNIHSLGIPVGIYGIENSKDVEMARKFSVNCLITDFPKLIANMIHN
ncbi:MAG: Lysophospholipase D gdpd1 [Marteilia pararefringens]